MKTIRTPFSFEDGSVSTVSNVDTVVKQQIVDYFMTINGERIMNQTYGGNIPLLSFEINDPLVLSDYTLDAIPEANSHLSFGRVLGVSVVDNENSTFYENNVATVLVRYAVSPRTISTVKLVVDITFNEESDV